MRQTLGIAGGSMDRAAAERAMRQGGWLADQDEAFRAEVLAAARLVRMAPGGFLFHVADDPGGVYGLAAGGIGAHLPSADGELRLAGVLRPGTWFGYGPAMRGGPRSMAFSVIEESWLFSLPLPRVQAIARLSLAHQRAVMSMSEYGMDLAMTALGVLLLRAADKRVAATLLRMAPDDQPVRLTQAQLGEMVNADRQVVNRVLKALAARGWLAVGYGQITVTDRAALAGFLRG